MTFLAISQCIGRLAHVNLVKFQTEMLFEWLEQLGILAVEIFFNVLDIFLNEINHCKKGDVIF